MISRNIAQGNLGLVESIYVTKSACVLQSRCKKARGNFNSAVILHMCLSAHLPLNRYFPTLPAIQKKVFLKKSLCYSDLPFRFQMASGNGLSPLSLEL